MCVQKLRILNFFIRCKSFVFINQRDHLVWALVPRLSSYFGISFWMKKRHRYRVIGIGLQIDMFICRWLVVWYRFDFCCYLDVTQYFQSSPLPDSNLLGSSWTHQFLWYNLIHVQMFQWLCFWNESHQNQLAFWWISKWALEIVFCCLKSNEVGRGLKAIWT